MGWIGTKNQMVYALKTMGADQDKHGNILIYGELPCSFMGISDEIVISDKVECSIDKKRFSVAGLLGTTSYGQKVTVI